MQIEFFKMNQVISFNYEVNSLILESAKQVKSPNWNLGYLTDLKDQKKSVQFNFRDNEILQIVDFPTQNHFLILVTDNKGTTGIGLASSENKIQLRPAVLNFSRLMPKFKGVQIVAFQVFNPNSQKFVELGIIYSKHTVNGDNVFMLIDVNFKAIFDGKLQILSRKDNNLFMNVVYKKKQFKQVIIYSIKAVWIPLKRNYMLHVIYTGWNDGDAIISLYEAYLDIVFLPKPKFRIICHEKVAYKKGISDPKNKDLSLPIEDYQISIEHWNATVFSGIIEDRNDHQKIYTLSISDRECGFSKPLEGLGIYKLCVSTVQLMINDCGIQLEKGKVFIGPSVPINGTHMISTIYKSIEPQEYSFIDQDSQPENQPSEFFAFIFRSNIKIPKNYSYCERRPLKFKDPKNKNDNYEYHRWHSIFNNPITKIIHLVYKKISKSNKDFKTETIHTSREMKCHGYSIVLFHTQGLKTDISTKQIDLKISFKKIGYSEVVFNNWVYLNIITGNQISQVKDIEYNALNLQNLSGNSKYIFDLLPINTYQINSKKLILKSLGSMITSKDMSTISQDIQLLDEISDRKVYKIFTLGNGYIGILAEYLKGISIMRCMENKNNNLECIRIKKIDIYSFQKPSVKIVKIGGILLVYGDPKLDRNNQFLITIHNMNPRIQKFVLYSFEYPLIDEMIIKIKNNQALCYYLSEKNRIVFFRINGSGNEQTLEDLKNAMTYLKDYVLKPEFRDKEIQNIINQKGDKLEIRTWKRIYSSDSHPFYTLFTLIMDGNFKSSYRESYYAILQPGDNFKFRKLQRDYDLPGSKVIRVCYNNLGYESLINKKEKLQIKINLYSRDNVRIEYNLDSYNLKIRKIIEFRCLPQGKGSIFIGEDFYKNKILVILKKHPGNKGYNQGPILEKFDVEKTTSFDSVDFHIEGNTLLVYYAINLNMMKRIKINLARNSIHFYVGSKLKFDSFSQGVSPKNRYLKYSVFSEPLIIDGTTPMNEIVTLYYRQTTGKKDKIEMEGKLEVSQQGDPQLRVKINSEKGGKPPKIGGLLDKGKILNIEGILSIDGEYRGASVHSEISKEANTTKNIGGLVEENDIQLLDRLQQLNLNDTELKNLEIEYIDVQNEYTLLCLTNGSILLYKNIGSLDSKLILNSADLNHNRYSISKFSKQYESSKIPYIIFIGGVQGVVNDNNQYSNKIVLFYFKKKDPNFQIFTKEIFQNAQNFKIQINYFRLFDFQEFQPLSYYSPIDKDIKVIIFLINDSHLKPKQFNINPNNPNNSSSKILSIKEKDTILNFYKSGITIGDHQFMTHPGYPFLQINDDNRININFVDDTANKSRFIQGFQSTKENTNFLLTFDMIKMFRWKNNDIYDKKLITQAKRVLSHEYLSSIPSASIDYYGFLIREITINEKKYSQLKIVIYKVGRLFPYQILPVYSAKVESTSSLKLGVASISRSDHLYLSNYISKFIFLSFFFNFFEIQEKNSNLQSKKYYKFELEELEQIQ